MFLGVASLAVAAIAAVAAGVAGVKTFRTTGYFIGITQGTNPVTGYLQYDDVNLAGHNLVNFAMGRNVTDTILVPHGGLSIRRELP